jgi:hypothetical protein
MNLFHINLGFISNNFDAFGAPLLHFFTKKRPNSNRNFYRCFIHLDDEIGGHVYSLTGDIIHTDTWPILPHNKYFCFFIKSVISYTTARNILTKFLP